MKKQKFNRFKPIQMEAYFSRMQRSGQALKQVSPWSGTIEFVSCKPENMIYRLDFYQPSKKEIGFFPEYDHHYLTLFQDAGWEMVCGASPYVIWRKPVSTVDSPDESLLYNDREGVYQHYKRLVTYRVLSSIIVSWFSLATASIWQIAEWKWYQFVWQGLILLVWLAFVAYQLWMLDQWKKEV